MQRRVLIYGGTAIPEPVGRFAGELAAALLAHSESIVVVTGGFKGYRGRAVEGAGSVDGNVIRGAVDYLEGSEPDSGAINRLETWLPESQFDRPEVQRFAEGCGRIVRVPGTSAQARRFAMVRGVDAVITLHGEHHTRAVLDLAFTFGNPPAFPLPFTGSISEEYWKDSDLNRQRVIDWFNLDDSFTAELDLLGPADLDSAATERLIPNVVSAIGRGIRRSCLVLMPFGENDDLFFDRTLKRMIEAADFRAVRLDREIKAGHIPTLFQEHLRRHDAIVVDLTGWRPNVVYELGAAHALGTQPFLFRRDDESVPFYFRQHMRSDLDVSSADNIASFEAGLNEYLANARNG